MNLYLAMLMNQYDLLLKISQDLFPHFLNRL